MVESWDSGRLFLGGQNKSASMPKIDSSRFFLTAKNTPPFMADS
jgi:hypothetical protein